MGIWPTLNGCSAAKKRRISIFSTTLNRLIHIIHSTENKAIKEGATFVNSNYKSSRVASNFAAICSMILEVMFKKRAAVFYRVAECF